MNQKKSSRHHYIPVFFSKNFVNPATGQLIVFDKLNGNVFDALPDNVFLEKGRNTFLNKHGVKDDVLEKIFTHLDTYFAPIVKRVLIDGSLNGGNLKNLLFLAYFLKWRCPQYDDSFAQAKNFYTVDDLGLGLKIDGQPFEVVLEDLFETEFHQELKRIFLSVQPLRFKKDFKEIMECSFLIASPFPALLGDCPFHEATISDSEKIFEDFIFPISSQLTLVHCSRIDKFELQEFLNKGRVQDTDNFIKTFSIARDVATLQLAGRQAACADRDYILDIKNLNAKLSAAENTAKDLSLNPFSVLYNFKVFDSRSV